MPINMLDVVIVVGVDWSMTHGHTTFLQHREAKLGDHAQQRQSKDAGRQAPSLYFRVSHEIRPGGLEGPDPK